MPYGNFQGSFGSLAGWFEAYLVANHIDRFCSLDISQCMRFPTMWHFDMCRLGRASAASFEG